MSNQNLPISPLTGQPSKLRALVERSVRGGPQPGEVVNTLPGGSTVTFDPIAARGVPVAPGQLPGAQLSSRGLSPRDAVRASQQPIPARRELTPEVQPAPSETAAAVAAAVQQAMLPVVAQLSQAVAAAVNRQPVTRSAQPGRSVALNEGPGSWRGVPASYNAGVVARSLGYEGPIPAPKPRLKNCVELYQEDKLRVTLRNGIW